MNKYVSTFIIKPLKIIGWIVGVLIFLILVIALSTRIPFVQDIIKDKAITFFKNKTNTEASIGSLYFNFPSGLELNEVYVEDLQGDTLAYVGEISVDANILGLLDNELSIDHIYAGNVVANITNTNSDSTFNYQFIIDAFAPADTAQTTPQDTTAAPFSFGLYSAEVENASIHYHDVYNGMELLSDIGYFTAEASVFDLNNGKIFVDLAQLENSTGSFRITKDVPSDDTTASAPFYVDGEQIRVSSVNFTFEDVPGGMRVVNNIGQASIEADSVNIVDQVYQAKDIRLLNSFVSVDMFKSSDTTQTESGIQDSTSFSLLASSENISMTGVGFRFYDHTQPVSPESFDPTHLWVQDVDLRADDIRFQNGFAEGNIEQLNFTEAHGFTLLDLNTRFAYTDTRTSLESLYAKTRESLIRGDLAARYASIDQLTTAPEQVQVNIQIAESRIAYSDISYFVPNLSQTLPVNVPRGMTARFNGQVTGTLASLNLENADLTTLNRTALRVSGRINGLPDVNELRVDIPRLYFQTSRQDIQTILPDTLIPPTLSLPDSILLKASLQGSMQDITAGLMLTTSMGNLEGEAQLTMGNDSVYSYNAAISGRDLELGKLISNPDLGMTGFSVNVKGTSFDPETINATIDGTIHPLFYMDYSYDTIRLEGNVAAGNFEGTVSIADPNLAFDFDGLVGYQNEINEYSFNLDIERADLRALNFVQGEFQLVGNVTSDISASSIDNLNGYVEVKDLFINRNDIVFPVDSLYFRASATSDSTSYHLFSNFLDFDFKGTFRLSQLPVVIEQHFSKYYELDESDTTQLTELRPQQFTFDIDIKDTRFFKSMVPGLNELRPGEISGTYNSSDWLIDLQVDIYELSYSGILMDSIQVRMDSDENHLTYEVAANKVGAGPITLPNLLFEGDVESDNIKANLHILDESNDDRYLFGGIFISLEDHYRFMFTPGKFITNYTSWDVKPSNSINIYDNDLWFENLFLEHEEQELRIFSRVNDRGDSVLMLDIEKLMLSELGRMTEDSVSLITGIVQGETELNLMGGGTTAFTSDLLINSFSYKGDTLGNVKILADTENGEVYDVDVGINGSRNDIRLTGSYRADSLGTVDMSLAINRLALPTIESFTAGQLSNMEGYLTGDVSIGGVTSDLDIDGRMRFMNVGVTSTFTGSRFTLNDQLLRVNNNGIRLDNFTIRDENDNRAVLNGSVQTDDFLVYDLDLDIRTRRFRLLNRPLPETIAESENPFYGKVELTSDMTIGGTSLQPEIQLNASFGDGTTFAYVIPEATVTEQAQKDVVEWFDQDVEEIDFFALAENVQKDSVQRALEGIDLTANITVTPQNELTIVIDPVTGDRLTVSGEADLSYSINPSGNQTLTGRYEVSSGSYSLNFYNLIKREFLIQEGSYILWTGDPLNAIMNVTAIYEVRATPIGVNNFQGKLDFQVYLDIGGQLLNPEISFRLGIAEDSPAPIQVQAWVDQQNSQEERVNKQVFGLLLFQSFFPDDSYASAGNVNLAANTARGSVSRMLSAQLNRLSNQIQGVDLSIDIDSYEDYSSSGETYGRTELELGVSKELFNERVVVKLAGNVDLEGNRSRQGVSDFAGDIQIEYKLTEDGRFRLLGFRNNEFDNLQGEIIRTGVGIIYVREYNAFKELFKKTAEEKQLEKEREEAEAREKQEQEVREKNQATKGGEE